MNAATTPLVHTHMVPVFVIWECGEDLFLINFVLGGGKADERADRGKGGECEKRERASDRACVGSWRPEVYLHMELV